MTCAVLGRFLVTVSLAAIASLAIPQRASACSCATVPLQRHVVPSDGTMGFPVNGTIRVFLTAFPESLRSLLASDYRLVDAKGAVVPLEARVVETRLDLRPTTPLQAGGWYTLEQLFAFDSNGLQVNDTQRLHAAVRGPWDLRLAWFAVVSFTTGAPVPATRAPVALSVSDARVEYRAGGGDCGPGIQLVASLTLPQPLRATDTLELEIRTGDAPPKIVDTRPASGVSAMGASDLACDPDPIVIPADDDLEVRVVVIDPAGVRVGESSWESPSGSAPWQVTPEWSAARLVGVMGGRSVPWPTTPIVAPVPEAPSGPAGCPHGLEVVSRVELASTGGPWMYDQHALLVSNGARGWIALTGGPDGSTTDVLTVNAKGHGMVLRAGLEGFPVATALSAGGLFVVSHAFTSPAQQSVVLRALTPRGETRWEAALPTPARSHRIAVGSDLVLATWTDMSDGGREHLSWRLFGEKDGRPLGNAVTTTSVVSANGAAVAAWCDGSFLVAWPGDVRTSSVHAMTISPEGVSSEPLTLPVRADGPIDVAVDGSRVGLVSEERGSIAWLLLSSAGNVERGPVVVNEGVPGTDQRKPRVTAHDGLFAVSWECNGSRRTYSTVVSAAGVVAPTNVLDESGDASTALVIAGPRGTFLATHGVGHEGRVLTATLQCRQQVRSGAPQRIALP